MSDLNPITYSVIINSLNEISAEIDDVMIQTARNVPVIMAHDFSVGITDGNANLVSSTQGLPIHLGSLDRTVETVVDSFDKLRPGDIVLCNDTYRNFNTHLPDFTMVHPVFAEDGAEPLLYVALRADQADIGAKDPVRSPVDTEEIYNEGLLIPPVKVVDNGERRQDVLDLIVRNSRAPILQRGDLSAMISAVQTGGDRATQLVEKFSAATVDQSTDRLLQTTEQRVREYVADLPDGTYTGECETDSNPGSGEPVRIAVTVTVDGEGVEFDFSDSDEQVHAPINNSIAVTYAAVMGIWFATMDFDLPFNAGCVSMIDIVAPEGLIVNPEFPHANGYSTVDCGQETMEAVLRALAKIIPGDATAGWARWVRPLLGGVDPRTDNPYRGVLTSVMGGSGAIEGRDGVNLLGGYGSLGGLVAEDPEMLEAMYPLTLERVELRTDSGGAGTWRGGLGVDVEVTPDDHEALFSVGGDFGVRSPPFGHRGGDAGQAARVYRKTPDGTERIERSWTNVTVGPEESYLQRSGSGGGVGPPTEREPARVRADVEDGYVSMEAARKVYGVALDDDLTIDHERTEELRTEDDDD
jgi:N-methylhydantoinase B